MISADQKQAIIADLGKGKTNTGSPAAQVGMLTARITELTDHLKVNKKDHAARRGLLQMVGKRKKLLKYIADRNSAEYLGLIKKLGLRR
ncbi:MAG: 30S ribosomal protein S15 [bacterium]|nr:30S ribosomal protein S15 [bacterium]